MSDQLVFRGYTKRALWLKWASLLREAAKKGRELDAADLSAAKHDSDVDLILTLGHDKTVDGVELSEDSYTDIKYTAKALLLCEVFNQDYNCDYTNEYDGGDEDHPHYRPMVDAEWSPIDGDLNREVSAFLGLEDLEIPLFTGDGYSINEIGFAKLAELINVNLETLASNDPLAIVNAELSQS